jgi:hypothetical protein
VANNQNRIKSGPDANLGGKVRAGPLVFNVSELRFELRAVREDRSLHSPASFVDRCVRESLDLPRRTFGRGVPGCHVVALLVTVLDRQRRIVDVNPLTGVP